jgi:TolB-like protein/Flp pilus assembly protein TadD
MIPALRRGEARYGTPRWHPLKIKRLVKTEVHVTSRPGERSAVPRSAVFEQLERILTSQPFQTSERSTRLLRFLIEQSISGRSERLKEFEIGTEALGKDPAFDPRVDPIVRSEVSRLRNRLEKYYATTGQGDPLIIVLPKGSYLPQIQTRSFQPADSRSAPEKGLWGLRRLGGLAAGVVATACVLAIVFWSQSPRPSAPRNISIAVLPFANLSGDASQEFFSAGMTEELTTTLATIPDLRVVARGSASRFKGDGNDVRTVGQALGASHLIQGSVRRDGARMRVTAQLVSAEDGLNVWAQSYDRDVTDLFAIQSEIATAIAGALRMPLGLRIEERLARNGDIDPESYEQFLLGKSQARGRMNYAYGIVNLEQVLAKHPNYAPAHAALARALRAAVTSRRNMPREERQQAIDTIYPRAVAAARQAIELDPNLPDAHVVQALLQQGPRQWALAEDALRKALTLDPTYSEALQSYSSLLLMVGRIKEGLAMTEQLLRVDSSVPFYSALFAGALWLDGQTEPAVSILEKNIGLDAGAEEDLMRAYSALGRYNEAADIIAPVISPNIRPETIAAATRFLRAAPARPGPPETLPPLGSLGFIYLHIGAAERALDFFEDTADMVGGGFSEMAVLWHPSYAPVRKLERFKAFVQRFGLVEYWRERGWPSFCHPTSSDDFVCQ